MEQLHVAVGIIRNIQQEIFITQRVEGSHMAGFWEFPGGKVEQGETPEIALKRELLEETGIIIRKVLRLSVSEQSFSDKPNNIVILHFYLVEEWSGEPFGREGQPAQWVEQSKLREDDFPPSNASIIQLLNSSM